ncbi:MAG TPA: hypothetical protein VMG12_34415 [Polyangiaceae bacterium]|nr:hypothetical protein [Polyangiaceae bacterium]
MSSRRVPQWTSAVPVIGMLALGCGDDRPPLHGSAGGGGGTSSTGGTSGQAGSGAGGGNGGSSGVDAGNMDDAGSGGSGSLNCAGGVNPTPPYAPVGIGDPWYFSSSSEVAAFEVEYENSSGSISCRDGGEVHIPLTFGAQGGKARFQLTAPLDSKTDTQTTFDLRRRVLRAQVRVGTDATASGGVEAFSQSSDGATWVSGEGSSFTELLVFTDLTFDFDTAADPRRVIRFGLQAFATSEGSAEIIIDDLRLEPGPDLDAGVREDGGRGDDAG